MTVGIMVSKGSDCELGPSVVLESKSSRQQGGRHPNWKDAMQGCFAYEYWKAAVRKFKTLEKVGTLEVVDRTDGMNVIGLTWALKLKRFPDGLIKKCNARFCARGDHQKEGIDFFETHLLCSGLQFV